MRQERSVYIDYVLGLVWSMLLVPIVAGLHGFSGMSWLLVVPTIVALGFFLGWLISQYRRMDLVGAQRQAWRTVRQRQSWYKRIRLVGGWLFLQTAVVFTVWAFVDGDAGLLVPLGLAIGAAGASVLAAVWKVEGGQLEQEGWRW